MFLIINLQFLHSNQDTFASKVTGLFIRNPPDFYVNYKLATN